MALLGACADPSSQLADPTPQPDANLLPLQVTLQDSLLVQGGTLVIHVDGAPLLVPEGAEVQLAGDVFGEPVNATFEAFAQPTEDGAFSLQVSAEDLQNRLAPGQTRWIFQGTLRCTLNDASGQLSARGDLRDARLTIVDTLTPTLSVPPRIDTHLGQDHTWTAEGILRLGEGQSWLELEGQLHGPDGQTRPIASVTPIEVGPGGRHQARLRWQPALTGIEPGRFEGQARVVNQQGTQYTEGLWQPLTTQIAPTTLQGLQPRRISRGQKLLAIGKGLINPGNDVAMYFELAGRFVPLSGPQEDVIWLWNPEAVDNHEEASLALRTDTEEHNGRTVLKGMSSRTGTFIGQITPILLNGPQEVRGLPWDGRLTLAPTHQVVFVRFLPGYLEALETFGLRNLEPEVRAWVFDTLRSHYGGLNISFVDQPPTEDWLEYTTIEVSGRDPNGAGLLGLDNSDSKDVGNLRLDDVIGGVNAQAYDQGYHAFGGVFVASFEAFSPALWPNSPLASERFDQLFAPITPALGGSPVLPGDGRGLRAAEAMGNLIGHTLTHELGHALGLALREDGTADPDHHHNIADQPGALMDEGQNRPFEERCGLLPDHPTGFNATHRRYLESILPIQPQ